MIPPGASVRSPGRWPALLLVWIVVGAAWGAPQSEAETRGVTQLVSGAQAERSKLAKIVGSKNAAELQRQGQPASKIGKMVYATKAYSLKAEGAELEVLRSMPSSAAEMEAFDEFMHSDENKDFEPLYREYYANVFQSAVKHREYLHGVFALATQFDTKIWPNYDDVDWFCSRLGAVHRAIPHDYDAAAGRENKADRAFLRRCAAN